MIVFRMWKHLAQENRRNHNSAIELLELSPEWNDRHYIRVAATNRTSSSQPSAEYWKIWRVTLLSNISSASAASRTVCKNSFEYKSSRGKILVSVASVSSLERHW
ncbi:hypothetical protein NPIL_494551 [Nephila pilipes]|uniref:Uncharacterized protein n=1 Tax=Nephila pilipes TaxID=299642 RepID=A0A8X6NQH4_NEPPI|nr:hypothetical protein NPIL_494551 [Nephila pilipes]